jgi:hypothetical protein
MEKNSAFGTIFHVVSRLNKLEFVVRIENE